MTTPRVNDSRTTWLATSLATFSDDGATFTKAKVSKHAAETDTNVEGDQNQINNPAIVLGGGKTFIAYNQEGEGCGADGTGCWAVPAFATATGASTTFTYELAKDSSDADRGRARPPSAGRSHPRLRAHPRRRRQGDRPLRVARTSGAARTSPRARETR